MTMRDILDVTAYLESKQDEKDRQPSPEDQIRAFLVAEEEAFNGDQ